MINSLKDILKNKKIERKNVDKKINVKWEQAREFCEYCGFPVDNSMIVFVLKLCKIYGEGKVYALKSWIKDAKYDKQKIKGLLIWKLKGGKIWN